MKYFARLTAISSSVLLAHSMAAAAPASRMNCTFSADGKSVSVSGHSCNSRWGNSNRGRGLRAFSRGS